MTEYPNWFKMVAQGNFEKHLSPLKGEKVRFLQLGAYTGDASVWMLENVLTNPDSRLYDVDTWEGSDEEAHHQMDWSDVELTYDAKINNNPDFVGKVFKEKMTTKEFFIQNKNDFDFIYIDADHTAQGTLFDGLFAMDNLPVGSILAFDDYGWNEGSPLHLRPKPAIEAIVNCFRDRWDVLELGYQVWLKRIA
jgi:predicted O-methyltransferase YrrM